MDVNGFLDPTEMGDFLRNSDNPSVEVLPPPPPPPKIPRGKNAEKMKILERKSKPVLTKKPRPAPKKAPKTSRNKPGSTRAKRNIDISDGQRLETSDGQFMVHNEPLTSQAEPFQEDQDDPWSGYVNPQERISTVRPKVVRTYFNNSDSNRHQHSHTRHANQPSQFRQQPQSSRYDKSADDIVSESWKLFQPQYSIIWNLCYDCNGKVYGDDEKFESLGNREFLAKVRMCEKCAIGNLSVKTTHYANFGKKKEMFNNHY